MGLMRRVEPSIESAVDNPRPTNDIKRADRRHRDKAPSVQVKELGQKLTKEMEEQRISLRGRTLASHRVTVYLCPQDYDRFAPRMDELVQKLERTVLKYARSKKYELSGEPQVLVEREPDLQPGYFGILAHRPGMERSRSEREAAGGQAPVAAPATAGGAAVAAGAVAARGTSRGNGQQRGSSGAMAAAGAAVDAMVVSAGDRVREFTRSRVILGRGQDADFRLDDPNVSRRHAALYWSEGRVVVEDLESTNGTMVNGYPVSSTVLRPRDVLVIGDTRVKVDIRSG